MVVVSEKLAAWLLVPLAKSGLVQSAVVTPVSSLEPPRLEQEITVQLEPALVRMLSTAGLANLMWYGPLAAPQVINFLTPGMGGSRT